jgi:hypothetical protein
MSEATPTLAEALVAAQAEMPKVKATGSNPHFGNEYITLEDLLTAVRPVLNRHGLSIHQFPLAVGEQGAPCLITILSHRSGDAMSYTMPLLIGKQDMQGLGSAITYARRYAIAAALGISEGEDDDGNAAAASVRNDAEPRVRDFPEAPDAGPSQPPAPSWTPSMQQRRLIKVVDDLIGKGNLTEQQVQSAASTTESWPRLVRALDDNAAAELADRLERYQQNLADEASNPVPAA